LNRVLPESRKDGIIMPIFKGAGVAIVTPFTQDDKVNFEELGKMRNRCDHHLRNNR
jgi:dihydrodipicolinate synthase/N-acetylneuraminate lyase